MTEHLLECFCKGNKDHALIFLDREGRITSWLAGAPTVLGYEEREMLGSSLDALFTREDRDRGEPLHEIEVARQYGKAEDDRWHVRKDGMRIWVSGVLTALHDDSGELIGFSKVLRDRTDIMGHIDALQRRIDALQLEARKKDIFLGTLAHELRNPLSPLASAARLITTICPGENKLRYPVEVIERQVRFVERLVEELLDVTRLGAGKVAMHHERVELGVLVRDALEMCAELVDERQQTVKVLLPGPVHFYADPLRLQQVIVNLVTNSAKFSPPRSVIRIKGNVEGNTVVLRVEDKGKGIPASLMPHLFELFSQAETPDGADRKRDGLGLGLALVKILVEMHGGTVQVRSEGADRGCEFVVRLPLRLASH